MRRHNILMQTDAYHQTMGYMLPKPLEIETHVLYHRRGGPMVVADLGETIADFLASQPTRAEVADADAFWTSRGIPFARDAWDEIASAPRLPLSVRGPRDGDVALPRSPLAVFRGPALLLGTIEPLLILRQQASLQLATRFVRVAAAVGWQTDQIFEVGLRAVAFLTESHNEAVGVLKRVGLKATSSGEAARKHGLATLGTVGHRFMQRFPNDRDGFEHAVQKKLAYQKHSRLNTVNVTLLLDTRSTLRQGVPAAIKTIRKYRDAIAEGTLEISVRFDTEPPAMFSQFREAAPQFLEASPPGFVTPLIFESGLDDKTITELVKVAKEVDYPSENVFAGVGGFFTGRIDRDQIGLAYKLSSYGGRTLADEGDHVPTMKLGDEPDGGKTSWPGIPEVYQRHEPEGHRTSDLIASVREGSPGSTTPMFTDLCVEGRLTNAAQPTDAAVAYRVRGAWAELGALSEQDIGHPEGTPVYQQLYERCLREAKEGNT